MDINIEKQLNQAQETFLSWKNTSLTERIEVVKKVGELLKENKEIYARAITEDMNKPIKQAVAEVEKCAYLCEYYSSIIHEELTPKKIQSPWQQSEVHIEPLGVLLGVMPWNYPFWQVMRFAIPSLLVGNTIVLKHASNVPQSAACLENIFLEAAKGKKIYQDIQLPGKEVPQIIAHPIIKAVSLTGSEHAGKSVAQTAGEYLKKCVLELGGSNAFIVCEDADLSKIIKKAVWARMQNAGQSCIAAKRFLVHQSKYQEFVKSFQEEMSRLKQGDAFDFDTEFGAMAREDLAKELEEQLNKSVAQGAEIIAGGKRKGAFFEPTLVVNATLEMPILKEETFGPLAVVLPFESFDEAINISNTSDFGLGVCIFTENPKAIKEQVSKFEESTVFINEMVTSDPNLPFGGIKKSGYGRELSTYTLLEFANLKTVVVNEI